MLELADLVGALARPRAIILMIQAGAAADEQIEALVPLLEPGDVIVDGGNARYQQFAASARLPSAGAGRLIPATSVARSSAMAPGS